MLSLPSDPYADIPELGLLYDAIPAYAARGDVGFYVEEAARAGGPVLELGAGTGRLLLAMARAGAAVTGVERSPVMLERCRQKLAAEPAAVAGRVVLRNGDVRDLEVGQRFALAIAPFRLLQHLVTVDDQLRCVAAVRRHLTPGGRFVFDVFNPSFRAMTTDRSMEREDVPARPLGDGRTVRRTVRIPRVRWIDQVNETELIYYLSDPSGASARYVQAFDMRWYLRAELEHLLARSGFEVQAIWGDFARGPLTDDAAEMIVCATIA